MDVRCCEGVNGGIYRYGAVLKAHGLTRIYKDQQMIVLSSLLRCGSFTFFAK